MFDPITVGTALSVASSAMGNLRKLFMAGRELESMGSDLSRWMGAVSDIDDAEKRSKNPSMLRQVFDKQSIEQAALESWNAKRKVQEMEDELKNIITFRFGTKAYDDFVQEKGRIRKLRTKQIYEARERKEKIITYVSLFAVLIIGGGILGLIAYGLVVLDRSA
jgi:hypothetical protein